MMLKSISVLFNILKNILTELKYFLFAFLVMSFFILFYLLAVYGIIVIQRFI